MTSAKNIDDVGAFIANVALTEWLRELPGVSSRFGESWDIIAHWKHASHSWPLGDCKIA